MQNILKEERKKRRGFKGVNAEDVYERKPGEKKSRVSANMSHEIHGCTKNKTCVQSTGAKYTEGVT